MFNILRILYRFFNKIYCSLFGMIIKFFTEYSSETPIENIIILGRGKSLQYFFKNYKEFEHIKHIVLANFQGDDLNSKTILSLKNKTIHFMLSRIEPTIPISQILKLKIGKVFFAKPIKLKEDSSSNRVLFSGNLYGTKVNYLTDIQEKYLKFCAGTGLYAIINSIESWNIKNVYLFGFDFYSTDYHDGKQHFEIRERVSIFKKPEKSIIDTFDPNHYGVDKPAFLSYVSLKKDVNFFIHTLADLEEKYKNLKFLI